MFNQLISLHGDVILLSEVHVPNIHWPQINVILSVCTGMKGKCIHFHLTTGTRHID